MRKTIILVTFIFAAFHLFANSWTSAELNSANTAANVSVLTSEEKEVIKYINLARMYPKKFADVEVENYYRHEDSPYRLSLLSELRSRKSTRPLVFDQEMYEYAKCFAIESGRAGKTGHNRTTCPKMQGTYGECCDYGNSYGKEIVLSLLIDHNVPGVGHRKNCLNGNFTKCGASIYSHSYYKYCCVIDFTNGPTEYTSKPIAQEQYNPQSAPQQAAPTPATKPTTQSSNSSSNSIMQQATPTPMTDEYHGSSQQYSASTTTKPTTQTTSTNQSSKSQQNTNYQSNSVSTPTTRPTSTGRKVSDNWQPSSSNSSSSLNSSKSSKSSKSSNSEKVRDQFYETSGKTYLSFVKVGYTVAPHINVHLVDVGVLDFRAKMFGLTLLNCEIKAYPFDEHFFYKPSIRLDIPISKFATLDLYGGAFTDIGETWKYFYHKDSNANLFVSGFGGMGLGVKNFLRLFVEYRFPIYGENPDRDLLTIYLGVQLSFGMKIKK